MKYFVSALLAISILLPMKSFSQNAPLTLEDLIPGGKTYNKYRAEMPRQMAWSGDNLTYVKNDTVYIAPKTDKEKPEVLFTLKDINAGLKEGNSPLKSLNGVRFISPQSNELMIYSIDKIYLYDYINKKVTANFSYSKDMADIKLAEKSRLLAYTKKNNLYLQAADGKEYAVTNETDEGIVCGQSVHRNEFGINGGGIFWSPQGNLLAFYRMDETMVTDYPLVDVSERVAKLKNIKYPMAGMKSIMSQWVYTILLPSKPFI